MKLLREIAPYLAAIAAVFGILYLAYSFGLHVEHQARVAEVAGIKRTHAEELAKAHQERADAEQRARDIEAQRAADMAALDAQHTKEMNDAKADADRTIADLRAGTLRLRERFTCPASTAAGTAGQAGTSTSLGDAAARYGLQPEDAEFLLSEAERADEVTVQLRACQAIVRGDRGGAP
jgi:prophage endopeptidase